MKADRLINLICHPEKIESDDLKELDTLVNRYPYFQAARVLYLKALNSFTSVRFRNELKASSVHIADHKQLYKYLNNLIEFDHLTPECEEKNSSLSNIVTDRIREINGYIPVNTYGVPAHKNTKNTTKNTTDDIVDINFGPQPSRIEKSQKTPDFLPIAQTKREEFPDSNVISNPIMLDDIPGLINDYSESGAISTPKPTYEVINHNGSQEYIIEPLSPTRTIDMSDMPGTITDYEGAVTEFFPIELIQNEEYHEQETTKEEEELEEVGFITNDTQILKQEMPEMLGAYQLEKSFSEEEQEISISQLAGMLKKKTAKKPESAPKNIRKSKNNLIDKFIEEEPSIPRGNLDTINEQDLSKGSNLEKEDLFSETLAKIYIKQKLFEKAIATYIKLSLKYPEKSVYFANRIEKIKDKINNNE